MEASHISHPNPTLRDAIDSSDEFRHMDKVDPSKQYRFEQPLPLRPGWNTDGKQILVRVNQFKVLDWPDKRIYQYDVSVSISSTQKWDFEANKISQDELERSKKER